MKIIKEYFHILVVVGLVISLILNIFLFTKINKMDGYIYTIMNNQSNLMNTVNNQTGEFHYALDTFMEEQKWISPIQMDVESKNLEEGVSSLRFEWQIKELLTSAEVKFHYKYGDTNEYKVVPAKAIGDGLFEAIVPININLEPELYISSIEEDSIGNYEEKPDKFDHDKSISYYVTVTSNELLKSSDSETENLDFIGASHYGFINADIVFNNDDFHVSVHGSKEESKYFIKEAYVIVNQNDKKVREEKLKQEKQNDDSYQVFSTKSNVKLDENPIIIIKWVYNNGKIFEKEIYPYK